MQPFLTDEEQHSVLEAIRELEARTSGELRVVLSNKWLVRPQHYAWKTFHRLGMSATQERNAALIIVMTRHRRFTVLGDHALNAVVTPGFWQDVARTMEDHMRNGHRLDALLAGIRLLGETMARHWPATPGNPDELTNEIVSD